MSHDLWTPEFEIRQAEVLGQDWPIVFVDKFEVNELGERRYVGSRSWQPVATPDRADHKHDPKLASHSTVRCASCGVEWAFGTSPDATADRADHEHEWTDAPETAVVALRAACDCGPIDPDADYIGPAHGQDCPARNPRAAYILGRAQGVAAARAAVEGLLTIAIRAMGGYHPFGPKMPEPNGELWQADKRVIERVRAVLAAIDAPGTAPVATPDRAEGEEGPTLRRIGDMPLKGHPAWVPDRADPDGEKG